MCCLIACCSTRTLLLQKNHETRTNIVFQPIFEINHIPDFPFQLLLRRIFETFRTLCPCCRGFGTCLGPQTCSTGTTKTCSPASTPLLRRQLARSREARALAFVRDCWDCWVGCFHIEWVLVFVLLQLARQECHQVLFTLPGAGAKHTAGGADEQNQLCLPLGLS